MELWLCPESHAEFTTDLLILSLLAIVLRQCFKARAGGSQIIAPYTTIWTIYLWSTHPPTVLVGVTQDHFPSSLGLWLAVLVMTTWRASTTTALTPNPEEALKPSHALWCSRVLDSLSLHHDLVLLFLIPILIVLKPIFPPSMPPFFSPSFWDKFSTPNCPQNRNLPAPASWGPGWQMCTVISGPRWFQMCF